MNDRDFMRYSRQILLDDIALDGQQKLLDSQVLIIGLGGLGTPAALYLAGAGVGTLVLADDDDVHLSNLQRQILFTTEDIDRPKSQVSQQRLTQLKPMWCSTVPTIWRLARRLMPPAWHSTRRLSPPARSDLAVS